MARHKTEWEIAAHQAIAEMAADLGAAFVLDAVAGTCELASRAGDGSVGARLSSAADLMRHMVDVLEA